MRSHLRVSSGAYTHHNASNTNRDACQDDFLRCAGNLRPASGHGNHGAHRRRDAHDCGVAKRKADTADPDGEGYGTPSPQKPEGQSYENGRAARGGDGFAPDRKEELDGEKGNDDDLMAEAVGEARMAAPFLRLPPEPTKIAIGSRGAVEMAIEWRMALLATRSLVATATGLEKS